MVFFCAVLERRRLRNSQLARCHKLRLALVQRPTSISLRIGAVCSPTSAKNGQKWGAVPRRQRRGFPTLFACTSNSESRKNRLILVESKSAELGINVTICWRKVSMSRSRLVICLVTAIISSISSAQTTSPYYHKFSSLQQSKGWGGYALLSPSWSICSSCSPTGSLVNWSRTPGISSPALSGSSSTKHSIGGSRPYSDVLWNNHIVGSFSSQGLPDYSNTITNNVHNFIYDVYFYATSVSYSQAVEFDINQFTRGHSFIWGHECRIAGGHQWDIYDNVNKKWVPTGVSCWPKNNAWNHVVIQVQRTSGGNLLYKSISLNGTTHTLNISKPPGSSSWSGVTINYQQDGNSSMWDYSVWLDKLTFTIW